MTELPSEIIDFYRLSGEMDQIMRWKISSSSGLLIVGFTDWSKDKWKKENEKWKLIDRIAEN